LDIPPAILVLDGSGHITLDAIDWLSAQAVPLIRLRWDGQFTSIVTGSGQAANSKLVHWQAETRENLRARIDFSVKLIRHKAEKTIETMETHVPRSKVWDSAMHGIERRIRTLDETQLRSVNEVLGFEGGIAADYFRAWTAITLKWQATRRYPIPDDWRSFSSRSAVRLRQHSNNRATHPVNAMLNYAYGVLLASMQVQLIAEGHDPTLGIMHIASKEQGKSYPGFALDRMEPMRPVVDRAILRLISEATFTGADFAIQDDGTCRLNPELARRIAKLSTTGT
jgi:CRISP-associated protein Cas1